MTRQGIAKATTVALLALLVPAAPLPVATARAAGAEDLRFQVEVLAQDLEALRQDIWTGVRLNGYYAFEYHADNRAQSPTTFDQNSFNLFVGRNWERWRVLAEIEYEHGPEVDGDGTTVDAKGMIALEFGWFEYRHHDGLIIRGGKFLLPQYWNVNHYAPVVLSTTVPLMVRRVFPKDTVGLMAHGKRFVGSVGASYTVYYANGQSAEAKDDNENKAVGGRAVVHLAALSDRLSRLDVGVSAHSERADAFGGALDVVGVDMQLNTVRYEILFEYATRESNPDTEGFYVQPSARLFGEVRGFYRYGYLDDGTRAQTRHTLGVNWRPRSNVSLKLEGMTNNFSGAGAEAFDEIATSVALFF